MRLRPCTPRSEQAHVCRESKRSCTVKEIEEGVFGVDFNLLLLQGTACAHTHTPDPSP